MNEWIDRVARAIQASRGPRETWDHVSDQTRDLRRSDARAAIAAMREPSETMVVDGFEAMKGDWQMCRDAADDARRCWAAMIDAALQKEEAEPR